ncbi:MAG: hypothetical protein JNK04_09860, partial [Myxococcales bacterium]|nr:hypothetical protein [Myxococcales bacterium]
MNGPFFHVCSPRDVGLARYVLARLRRPEWLDIPWVHGTASLDLERDIVEDPADFPRPLMAEASLVSLALRTGALHRVSDMFLGVRSFAFYPAVTHAHLTQLLLAKGFQQRLVPESDREEVAREPSPREARKALFGWLSAPPDTPVSRELFWEWCEDDPAHAAMRLSESSTLLAIFAEAKADHPRLAETASRLAPQVPPGKAFAFLAACAKAGLTPGQLKDVVAKAPRFTGDPPYLTAAAARAMYPRCAPETKKKLLQQHGSLHDLGVAEADAALRAVVAPLVSAPAHIAALSTDPDPAVRAALSGNQRVDGATLDRLANADGASDEVALAVAKHPKAEGHTLMRYVTHPRDDVRSSIAQHTRLPLDAVLQLARDASSVVRLSIARRPDLPVDRRLAFKLDPHASVRAVAIAADPGASADELSSVPAETRQDVRLALIKVSTDPVLLAAFSMDSSNGVRIAIGHNAHTPTEVLDRLSREVDGYVRGAVAANPAAGATILGRLAVDQVPQIRPIAAASLGKLRKAQQVSAPDSNEIPPEIEEVLLDPLAGPRRELTRQRELGRAVLEILCDDADV